MWMRKETMLAIATAVLAVSGCKTSLGGLVKLPGGSAGGASKAPSASPSSGGDAPVAAPAGESREERRAREDAARKAERTAESWKIQLQWIEDNLYVIAPAEGAPTIGATKPTWCDAVPAGTIPEPDLISLRDVTTVTANAYEKDWWARSPRAAQLMCAAPDEPAIQKQAGHYLQAWANLTGLDAKGLTPLMKLIVAPEASKAARVEACEGFVVDAEASGRDRELMFATQRVFGCVGTQIHPSWYDSNRAGETFGWYYDTAATPPSELARTQFVLQCLADGWDPLGQADLGAYALCGTDGRALDAKKLEKEIAGLNGWAQATARIAHATARYRTGRLDAFARKLAKKDEAVQTLVFDVPAKAWKEWQAMYADHKSEIDAAVAYEQLFDGASKKAAKGCWKEAWGNLVDHVHGKRSVEAVQAALTDPVGTIIVGHVAACAIREGDEAAASTFLGIYLSARPVRGPRLHAAYARMDAAADIAEDRPKSGVSSGDPGLVSGNPLLRKLGASLSFGTFVQGAKGVIGSLEKTDKGVKVTFKAVMVSVDDYDCVPTDRIRLIDDFGKVHYEENCRKIGSHKVNDADPPVIVPAAWASSLAVGRYVRFGLGGLPGEVWKDEHQKSLVAYLGIEL